MEIAILGAGGIGGYLAAKLTQAGHPVALIARGAHLEAIRDNGLRLIEPGRSTIVHPAVLTDDPGEIAAPELIVVTVKAHQLAAALAAIAPAVGPNTQVVTVQNGVDAPDMAAEAFGPGRVLACIARVFCNITGPGEVTRYGGVGSFTVGAMDGGQDSAPVMALRDALTDAGLGVPACADIRVDLWEKLMLFNAVSSTTAGARTRLGVVRETPLLARLARRLIVETFEVGRAEGVPLPGGAVDAIWEIFGRLPAEGRASAAHDLERGLALEIDHTCGSVARRGRALGIEVTASETVAALLEPFKPGRPDPGAAVSD